MSSGEKSFLAKLRAGCKKYLYHLYKLRFRFNRRQPHGIGSASVETHGTVRLYCAAGNSILIDYLIENCITSLRPLRLNFLPQGAQGFRNGRTS